MTKTKHTIVAALIAAALTTGAYAGSVNVPVKSSSTPNLTGALETKAVSNYTFRGQVLDSNLAFVPKLNLQARLFEGGTLLFSAEQVVGTRGSSMFRSEYNAGLALSLGRFTVTPGFLAVRFPNDGGRNFQSVTGQVSFNDEGLLPVALKPSIAVSKDTNPNGGTWYEASISPGTKFHNLELVFPVAVGLASDNYYGFAESNLKYAYASAGVTGVYHVTDRFALKAGVVGYTTDAQLANQNKNFVTTNVGVAVSF